MAQNESNHVDLNVRIIQAVEYCPLLYKGRATIEERQAVWQQLSQQLNVPESIVKSRWHILCGYYQRYLEKRRSTDDDEIGDDGVTRSDFRYEREMEFMMPYMHARIAIAAANAAIKQQEMAAAGNKELTNPEFVITEKDLEIATRINNNVGEDYLFYDVEALDGETTECITTQQQQHNPHQQQYEQYQQHLEFQHQQHMDDGMQNGIEEEEDEDIHEQHLHHIVEDNSNMQVEEEINEEVIEEVDESGNIVVQNLIIEGSELVSEDGEQIVVEEEEVLQMDDQIETVIEEVVDHTPFLDHLRTTTTTDATPTTTTTTQEHLTTQTVFIQSNNNNNNCTRRILRVIPTTTTTTTTNINDGGVHKYAKIMQETIPTETTAIVHNQNQQNHNHPEKQQHKVEQPTSNFAQEYAIMTRRRRAIVLKATPRVQVELTDNATASNASNSIEIDNDHVTAIEGAAIDVAANDVVVNDNCIDAGSSGIPNTSSTNHHDRNHNHHRSNVKHQRQDQQHHKRSHDMMSHDSGSECDNRSNDSNVVTTTAAEHDDDHTTKGERSEDTIFGELVTAMLRHMPQDRKRAIKKSIMDLLLT